MIFLPINKEPMRGYIGGWLAATIVYAIAALIVYLAFN